MKVAVTKTGFSLVELVIAMGVFAIMISGITFLAVGSYSSFFGSGNNREQERFAREALEAIEVIKERSWTEIDSNDGGSNLKVIKDGSGNWSLSAGTETRGSFTRAVTIATVQRNASDDIVASGGTDDPTTKKVTITISASGRSDYVVETYITNWEAFRMSQTDWGGAVGTALWTEGSTAYNTTSDMDLPTSSGFLMLASSTAE